MKPTWPIRFAAAALAGAALLVFVPNPRVAAFQNPEPRKVDFATEVLPIFEKSCGNCHGPKMRMSGLRLDTKPGAFAGGENGKAIIPGKSDESPLYQRIAGLGGLIPMPMGGKPLDPAQVATIKAWIDQGAEWPDNVGTQVEAAVKKHWAFIPPVRPELPAVSNAKWISNPIDAFILARLDREQLAPSPEADRVTLLRRLSLDLIGLPPTPAEVDAFVNDKSRDAYQKQVERLLASPHYGE